MQYKTIVLELIKQRPKLHQQLVSSKTLISTMDRWANLLRENHLSLMEQLGQTRPGSTDWQLASEAMEIATEEIEAVLPSESADSETETFSLDEAIAFVRRHTPTD